MKSLFAELRPALLATAVLAAATCGAYPALVTVAAQALFPSQAHGSLITGEDGTVRGSTLLGQRFMGEGYFQPRPSAAGSDGYDASSSSGSNLGPTSRKLHDLLQQRVEAYRGTNGLSAETPVPADAVTASASGLDPHISPENAALQAPRVARVRGLSLEKVKALITASIQSTPVLGTPGVNVLELNLALDQQR